MKPLLHALLTCTILATAATLCGAADLPQIILPKHRLQASDLAIIVNDADPLSRQIANYYQQRRGICGCNRSTRGSAGDDRVGECRFLFSKALVRRRGFVQSDDGSRRTGSLPAGQSIG